MSASCVRSLTFPIHGIIRIAIVGGGRRWNARTMHTHHNEVFVIRIEQKKKKNRNIRHQKEKKHIM